MLFLLTIFTILFQLVTNQDPRTCNKLIESFPPIKGWLQANLSGTFDWVPYNDVMDIAFSVCSKKVEYFESCKKNYPQNDTMLNAWNKTLEDYCYFKNEMNCYENHTAWKCVNETMKDNVSAVGYELFKEYITIIKSFQGGSNWNPDKVKLSQVDADSHKKICW